MFLLSRWSGGLVARYGGEVPLVIGPLLTATGFVLFAVLARGGGYWKTFFPASAVLGLGMAVTVAPLTTVVMSSVDQDHAGSASGINNAVARLAGVLAIAIFVILMVHTFSANLDRSLPGLPLSPEAKHLIQQQETALAGIAIPNSLDPAASAQVRGAIFKAFLAGFRLIMFCCAGLAICSSLFAWLELREPKTKSP